MTINRREFLGGVTTAAVAAALPVPLGGQNYAWAIGGQSNGDLAGVLWCQGETDCAVDAVASPRLQSLLYKNRLRLLQCAFRDLAPAGVEE